MLSRVAERVYWLSRYLERTENTARLLNAFSTLLMDMPPRTKVGWRSLVVITGGYEDFDASHNEASERAVMRFLLAEKNSHSILYMLSQARENARTTREIMPTETFEQINDLYLYAKNEVQAGISRGPRHDLLEKIISSCQRITGLMAGTLSHNEAYSFIRMGRKLERADMTTRIVDTGSAELLPEFDLDPAMPEATEPFENILWMNVLRSISAYQMYRQHVRDRINAKDVVMYLLQDREFPRAVAHCLESLSNVLQQLPNNDHALSQVMRTLRLTDQADIPSLLSDGLFHHIDDLQIHIAEIHGTIVDTWFLPRA